MVSSGSIKVWPEGTGIYNRTSAEVQFLTGKSAVEELICC